MKEIDVTKRTIGINFNEHEEAEVVVWAPNAEQIAIASNGDQIELKREDFGYWTTITDKIKTGSHYKYLLNNMEQYPDPASVSQPNGVHEKSEAIDLTNFKWNDENWNNIPLEQYIIYELHTGTFT